MSEVKDLIAKTIGNNEELKRFYVNEKQKQQIANIVFRLRNENGLSQEEFAKKVGLPVNTIVKIEYADIDITVDVLNQILYTFDKKLNLQVN